MGSTCVYRYTEALRVPDLGARLTVAAATDTDPAAVTCDDVDVPAYLVSPGVRTEVAVMITARRRSNVTAAGTMGDPSLLTVTACRYDVSASSLGRPLVLHVNADPGFAAGFSRWGRLQVEFSWPRELESAWFQPLKLKRDILVSNICFSKCNLCHYIERLRC
jgi:hypothetical protein